MKRRIYAVFLVLSIFGMFTVPEVSYGANQNNRTPSFFMTPSSGNFPIGSTFSVTISIDTAGEVVNAFRSKVLFPADKLQVISSGVGKSITGFWVNRPLFSNEKGFIELQGAIPSPGIETSNGVLATVTFRVKSIGQAIVRFGDETAMFLNDGNGTELQSDLKNAVFRLTLPPPAGPIVVSPTHPDQSAWYSVNDVIIEWAVDSGASGYSYVLSDDPIDIPDAISEGRGTRTVYRGISDGIHYFHIAALRGGVWGGVTHFGIKVQTTSPAGFLLDIQPRKRTSSENVIISFETSDPLSGIDRYEAKIIPLQPQGDAQANNTQDFFFELTSPYIYNFPVHGDYDVVVRAYNRAGNFSEAQEKISFVKPIFRFISDQGLSVGDLFIIPWFLFWLVLLIVIIILLYVAFHTFRWHIRLRLRHDEGEGESHPFLEQLKGLQERFEGSTKTAKNIILFIAGASLFLGGSSPVFALSEKQLPPPVVNLFSERINNNEIFYLGGRVAAGSGADVIIYLQSADDGQTFSFSVSAQSDGQWFYSHPTFLRDGTYTLWTQMQIGEEKSPPSSQLTLVISPTALQFGSSRLSKEALYLVLLIFVGSIVGALSIFIVYHYYYGKRKYRNVRREIREAEEAVRRGFATLRKDIQAELDIIHKVKLSKDLREEEKKREEQLMQDLSEVNDLIGKEVWDIERAIGSKH